jgi:mannosyltransferase
MARVRAGGSRPVIWRRPAPLAVAALTAIGVVLRIVGAQQSLAGDELFSYVIASKDTLDGVIDQVRQTESTPPLYYVLAWVSSQATHAEWAIRLPSLVFGSATVPVVYLAGRRLFDARAGVAAAALVAVSPFAVFFSVEGRAYGSVTFFVSAALLALLSALQDGRARWWIALVAASTAALWTHYIAVFPLAVSFAWALWVGAGHRRALAIAIAAVLLTYVPWLPSVRETPLLANIDLLYEFTPAHVLASLGTGGFGGLRVDAGAGILAFVLVLAGLGGALALPARRPAARANHPYVLAAALAAAAPVGLLIYSGAASNIFIARNLISSLPGLALLVGAVITRPRGWAWGVTAALTTAGLLVATVVTLGPRYRRPDWDAAARAIDARARPGDAVLLTGALPGLRADVARTYLMQLTVPLSNSRLPVALSTTTGVRNARPPGGGRLFVVTGTAHDVDHPTPPPPPPGLAPAGRTVFAGSADIVLDTFTPR